MSQLKQTQAHGVLHDQLRTITQYNYRVALLMQKKVMMHHSLSHDYPHPMTLVYHVRHAVLLREKGWVLFI